MWLIWVLENQSCLSLFSNMKKINLKTLFYTTLVMTFIVHILFIANKEFNPKLPETRKFKKLLKDIDFPLMFQFCAFHENDELEKYQKLGYKDRINFFRGRSLYNSSLVGWGGHTINQTNIASVKGAKQNFRFSK